MYTATSARHEINIPAGNGQAGKAPDGESESFEFESRIFTTSVQILYRVRTQNISLVEHNFPKDAVKVW